jgi:hypothetical protein
MHRIHKLAATGLAAAALVGALGTAGAAAGQPVAGWAWNGPNAPASRAWNSTHVVAGCAWDGPNAPASRAWNGVCKSNVTAIEYG